MLVECGDILCNESDPIFLDVVFVDSGSYYLEIFSDSESVIGMHEIRVQAVDEQRGFGTEVMTMGL